MLRMRRNGENAHFASLPPPLYPLVKKQAIGIRPMACWFHGAPGAIRTRGTRFRRAVLCPLSYGGVPCIVTRWRRRLRVRPVSSCGRAVALARYSLVPVSLSPPDEALCAYIVTVAPSSADPLGVVEVTNAVSGMLLAT